MSWLPHLPTADAAATENFEAIARHLIVGQGSPAGVVGAPVGVMYLDEEGGAGTTLYVKETAAHPTDTNGWVAK
jgi:hypothetical protein